VSFTVKAQGYAAHLMFDKGLAPSTIHNYLCGVVSCLYADAIIPDKSAFYSLNLTRSITNYKKVLDRGMFPNDGLLHDH
jgi:hypothetical protein